MKSFPNLLVVDDNPISLSFLEIVLKKLDINLIAATSGFEALEKIKGLELALAILDVQMPEMNGFELAVKLNEERKTDRVPIIFITANHINEIDVSQGYNCGAVDYIFKPVNRNFIISKVKVFLDLFISKQIIIDKSEQLEKKTEELNRVNVALKKNEEKYRSYIDNAPDGVFVTDETGRFLEVNKAACLISGYSNNELLTKSFLDLLPEESHNKWTVHLQNVVITHCDTVEVLLCHKSGEERWCSIETVKLSEIRYLGFVKDITLRKLSEDLLKESETNLATAQRIAHLGSWHWESKTNKIKLSKELFSIFDISEEFFDGKAESILKVLHPEDLDPTLNRINASITNNDESLAFEYRIIRKDNSIRYLFGEVKSEFDEFGNLENIFGIIQDISERKLAEQALKISEEKYRTIINASPDGILLIDLKGIITEVSEIGLEIFGIRKRSDIVGKCFHQFVPSEERNIIKDIYEKAMNEGLAQNIGIKLRKKNQSIFNAETSSTLIQEPDGTPLSFMVIIRDISQRKKIEAKQLHADRMANIGEMASGIAHEINQPLNIISMVMDRILFDGAKNETISFEFLKNKSDKIFDNITRIKNIIDHIRAFSRNDNKYVATAFDINSSIENAISMIQEQFKHLGIKLSLNLDKSIPGIVGSTYKLEQVIVNLLTNAKDALMEKKKIQPDCEEMIVEIETYSENEFLVVELTDNGIGIDKDDLSNVMLPFYTSKDVGKGTGLGLSICYQIVTEMGGTIDITSNKNIGTKIKLSIDIQENERG
nr:PAS domain S-box protein [uncultured Draconibacterium sp.]